MHMNLLQVQIKSLSAKPSLVHLGTVYSSQSPTGSELPRLLMSAETHHVEEMKQSLCFNVLKKRGTRCLKQQIYTINISGICGLNNVKSNNVTYEHIFHMII